MSMHFMFKEKLWRSCASTILQKYKITTSVHGEVLRINIHLGVQFCGI